MTYIKRGFFCHMGATFWQPRKDQICAVENTSQNTFLRLAAGEGREGGGVLSQGSHTFGPPRKDGLWGVCGGGEGGGGGGGVLSPPARRPFWAAQKGQIVRWKTPPRIRFLILA